MKSPNKQLVPKTLNFSEPFSDLILTIRGKVEIVKYSPFRGPYPYLTVILPFYPSRVSPTEPRVSKWSPLRLHPGSRQDTQSSHPFILPPIRGRLRSTRDRGKGGSRLVSALECWFDFLLGSVPLLQFFTPVPQSSIPREEKTRVGQSVGNMSRGLSIVRTLI